MAAVLQPMGLRMSEAKTRLTHIEQGSTFSAGAFNAAVRKVTRPGNATSTPTRRRSHWLRIDMVRQLTRRASHRTLADLLRRLNAVIRGWCAYFQHRVSNLAGPCDPLPIPRNSHPHTMDECHGMIMWRAGCSGMGTSGSEGGQQKPPAARLTRRCCPTPTPTSPPGRLCLCGVLHRCVLPNDHRLAGGQIDDH